MIQATSPRRSTTLTFGAMSVLCIASMHAVAAHAQSPEQSSTAKESHPTSLPAPFERDEQWRASSVDRAYKLKYTSTAQDANELLVALRNMVDPRTKIFLVPSTGMIVVHAPDEEQARIAKLLTTLDLPKSRYRLSYTLTELDGTRKVGVQHFSMVVLSGQRSEMKQGSRLPISVGGSSSNFTYLDVGMNFDATLQEVQGGGVLKSRVEQSSIAPDSPQSANPNPVLRQTQLEGTTSLTLGKPQLLGSLDVPSSTHHFDIEVQMDPVN